VSSLSPCKKSSLKVIPARASLQRILSQAFIHPDRQVGRDSFSPTSKDQFSLSRVSGTLCGKYGNPHTSSDPSGQTATDGSDERFDHEASTPSVFDKITVPGTGRHKLPPSENWNPYGPIKTAIMNSVSASAAVASSKKASNHGHPTNTTIGPDDQLATHQRELQEADKTIISLLDSVDPRPTRQQFIDFAQEMSGNPDDNDRHGDLWLESVSTRACRGGWGGDVQ
jgi:hypothetical protein